jgi:hypothetical protein
METLRTRVEAALKMVGLAEGKLYLALASGRVRTGDVPALVAAWRRAADLVEGTRGTGEVI